MYDVAEIVHSSTFVSIIHCRCRDKFTFLFFTRVLLTKTRDSYIIIVINPRRLNTYVRVSYHARLREIVGIYGENFCR